jgi:CheY-like chemotaxis protein
MRILVADDDRITRMLLVGMVRGWGYEVIEAHDGEAAWDAMRQADAPRMAVLDWMMPGLTGPEVCARVRILSPVVPRYLVLLTGLTGADAIVEGLESGADEFVTKPCNPVELRARLQVGRRLVELQEELARRERFQGVLEMAGAVCHELNQPLQVVSGFSELLLANCAPDDPRERSLRHIRDSALRLGGLTAKMMRLTDYRAKDYLSDGTRIVDIDGASRGGAG